MLKLLKLMDPKELCITRENMSQVEQFFAEVERVLCSLKCLDGSLLIASRLKTFIVGFLADMKCLVNFSKDLFNDYPDVW